MAKKKRYQASERKSKRAKTKVVRKLEVPFSASKATIPDVEAAIAEKLATQPTDLFMKNEKIIIELEEFEDKGNGGV